MRLTFSITKAVVTILQLRIDFAFDDRSTVDDCLSEVIKVTVT